MACGRIQGLRKCFLNAPHYLTNAPIISGTRKATNFKFGSYIHTVHVSKSPFKIWEKRERGRIQGLSIFLEYPLLSKERLKIRTSIFVRTFLVSIGTNARYKFREK